MQQPKEKERIIADFVNSFSTAKVETARKTLISYPWLKTAVCDDYPLLHHAARLNKVDIIRLLIQCGADIEAEGGVLECTPLLKAARHGSTEAVKTLLDFKADASMSDSEGNNCLHRIFYNTDDIEVAETLFKHPLVSLDTLRKLLNSTNDDSDLPIAVALSPTNVWNLSKEYFEECPHYKKGCKYGNACKFLHFSERMFPFFPPSYSLICNLFP